jgi:hypothetical protein
MITGFTVLLAIVAGIAALACAADSAIALERGRKTPGLLTGWLSIGLLAAALALIWSAK